MKKINVKEIDKWKISTLVLLFIIAVGFLGWFVRNQLRPDFEVTNEQGGNIFPSVILSTAATGATYIEPQQPYLGRPLSCIALKIKSTSAHSHVLIDVGETLF